MKAEDRGATRRQNKSVLLIHGHTDLTIAIGLVRDEIKVQQVLDSQGANVFHNLYPWLLLFHIECNSKSILISSQCYHKVWNSALLVPCLCNNQFHNKMQNILVLVMQFTWRVCRRARAFASKVRTSPGGVCRPTEREQESATSAIQRIYSFILFMKYEICKEARIRFLRSGAISLSICTFVIYKLLKLSSHSVCSLLCCAERERRREYKKKICLE